MLYPYVSCIFHAANWLFCLPLWIQTSNCSLWLSCVLAACSYTSEFNLARPLMMWYRKVSQRQGPDWAHSPPILCALLSAPRLQSVYCCSIQTTPARMLPRSEMRRTDGDPLIRPLWQIDRLRGTCITHPTNQISHLQQGHRFLLRPLPPVFLPDHKLRFTSSSGQSRRDGFREWPRY